MAVAGYCRVCGRYVYLNDQWGCANGHPWNEISNWYDPETGTRVTPSWMQPPPAGAAAAPSAAQPAGEVPAAAPVAAPATPPASGPAPGPAEVPAVAQPVIPVYTPPPPPAATAAAAPATTVTAASAVPAAEVPVTSVPVAAVVADVPPVTSVSEPAVVATPAPAPAETPAQTPADPRLALLADILEAFGPYPDYQIRYGTDTDIVIDNHIASAAWGVGRKKVDYSAIMKAVEAERTVYYWELLKEQGAGITFGGTETETYSTFGAARSGSKKEVVIGANGVAIDYEWDYGTTRSIVESVAARHGWTVKVVLRKKSAQW